MNRMTKTLVVLTAFSLFFIQLSAKERSVSEQVMPVLKAARDTGWQGPHTANQYRLADRDTVVVFEEDFENNAEGWSTGSGWQLTTDEYNSETHSINSPNDASTLNGTFNLLSPTLSIAELGDGETMNFGFHLYCDTPDVDGDALTFQASVDGNSSVSIDGSTLTITPSANFNGDISSWDVSKVTDMSYMFYYAPNFNQDIGSWDVSSVTDMSSMFNGASSFNQDLSSWDVNNVTDMHYMFSGASAFNQNISSWGVSRVTNMEAMFMLASSFNQDLSSWDVSDVEYCQDFSHGATAWIKPKPSLPSGCN